MKKDTVIIKEETVQDKTGTVRDGYRLLLELAERRSRDHRIPSDA